MIKGLFRVFAIVLVYGSFSGYVYAAGMTPAFITPSWDGVPVSYSVRGQGKTTLVFVHGWSCDSRYWFRQVPHFSKKYRVVTIDLAGHGHSGSNRKDFTVSSFGQDVKAVVDKLDAKKVILIGHSMGGAVIAEAASRMPDRVIGLVGVDTLHNVELRHTQEEVDGIVNPFESDFMGKADEFVRGMFVKGTAPDLVDWVAADMACALPRVGISALRSYLGLFVTGEAAKIFERVKAPVRAVNADLWPTDPAANRRHMVSFDAVLMKGAGHFPMLEKPDKFNALLSRVIDGMKLTQK